jgi:hypothetical protein
MACRRRQPSSFCMVRPGLITYARRVPRVTTLNTRRSASPSVHSNRCPFMIAVAFTRFNRSARPGLKAVVIQLILAEQIYIAGKSYRWQIKSSVWSSCDRSQLYVLTYQYSLQVGLIKVVTQNLRGKNVMFLVSVNPLLSRLHANTPIMHGYV